MASSPTILILNLPSKTFVGINLISFNSSPNFHGITNVPRGRHLLYTATDASLAIRHGQWLDFAPARTHMQVSVLRWNHEHESLELLDSKSSAAIAAVDNIPSLQGRGLVDYKALNEADSDLKAAQSQTSAKTDADSTPYEPWPILTSHITANTLTRILSSTTPTASDSSSDVDANRTSEHQPKSPSWTLSSVSSSPQDTETIPGLSNAEANSILHDTGSSSLLNFVSINLKQTWPTDSYGRDRTEKARDKSWYLNHLINSLAAGHSGSISASNDGNDKQIGARELLGELQFSFIAVLTLANYSALEQWKRILSVLLTCKTALGEVEFFFVEVVKVLGAMLRRVDDVEGGLFEMSDEAGSAWLRNLLALFRNNVNEVFATVERIASDTGAEQRTDGAEAKTVVQEHVTGQKGLQQELADLENWLRVTYGWEDQENVLKRGMVDLEDGERIEVQVDGLDEEEESGEYAPVVVEF